MLRNIEHRGLSYLYPDRVLWRSFNSVVIFGGLLVLFVTAGGCQRGPAWDLAPVEGTVTHAGQPLMGVRVSFLIDVEAGTKAPRASAMTDDAGHYRLRTDAGKWGAAVGQYRVCIDDPPRLQPPSSKKRGQRKQPASDDDTDAETKSRVPNIYTRASTTPLRAEVRPGGPQTFDFDIP